MGTDGSTGGGNAAVAGGGSLDWFDGVGVVEGGVMFDVDGVVGESFDAV